MDESSGAVILVVVVAVLLGLGLYVFSSIALGKIFVKLGEQAWKAWVPIVNTITLFEIGRYSALWVVGLFIPIVNIGAFIVFILAINNINRRLGHGGGFTLLYLVAFPIWAGVLGFGKSVNTGWLPVPAATGYVPFSPVPPLTGPAVALTPLVSAVPAVSAASPAAEPLGQTAAASSPAVAAVPAPPFPAAPHAASLPSVPFPLAPLQAAPPMPPAPAGPAAPVAATLPSAPAAAPTTLAAPIVRGLPTGPPPFYVKSPPLSSLEPSVTPAPPALAAPAPLASPAALAQSAQSAQLAAPPVAAAPAQPTDTDASPSALPQAFVVAATNAWARPAPVVQADATPDGQPVRAVAETFAPGNQPVTTAPVAPAPFPAAPAAPISAANSAVSFPDLVEAEAEAVEDDDLDETMIVVRRMKPWTLETEHGLKVSLTKPVVLLGRNPARGSAHPEAQLVLLQDPDKTVSKTHARLDFVDGAWGICDLQSTNGIVLIDGAGDESELDAGASASLTERFLLGELAARIYLEA